MSHTKDLPWVPRIPPLSWREQQVALLTARGWSAPRIATRFRITPSTVYAYRIRAYRKLKLNGISDITRWAVRRGWA